MPGGAFSPNLTVVPQRGQNGISSGNAPSLGRAFAGSLSFGGRITPSVSCIDQVRHRLGANIGSDRPEDRGCASLSLHKP